MTTKAQVLKIIRRHCIVCCNGSWTDVRDCSAVVPGTRRRCNLYPYRFGTDPQPARKGHKVAQDDMTGGKELEV